eukprot:359303-Chlamydomonas_euryale.AAC.1
MRKKCWSIKSIASRSSSGSMRRDEPNDWSVAGPTKRSPVACSACIQQVSAREAQRHRGSGVRKRVS